MYISNVDAIRNFEVNQTDQVRLKGESNGSPLLDHEQDSR